MTSGNPIKVLVISHMFPKWAGDSSGIFVYDQVKHLVEAGCDIKVISPQPWVPPGFSALKAKWRLYKSIPIRKQWNGFEAFYPRYVRPSGASFFSLSVFTMFICCVFHVLKLHRKWRFDVIQAHAVLPDGLVGWMMGKISAKPVVCTLHGSDINIYPLRDRLTYHLTRFALSRIKYLVSVSDDICKRVFQDLKVQAKINVIRNGADARLFHPIDKQSARKLLNLDFSGKIILFAGNLIHIKGAHLLVSLMANLVHAVPNIKMFIVGSGELEGYIRKEIALNKLIDHIYLCGRQPHERIPLWINASDVVVMPSLSEGYPTLVSETLACGRPIVASNVGGIPEIVNEKSGLLVAPNNLAALIEATFNGLTMEWCLQEIVKSTSELTWESNARQYIQIYQKIKALAAA